MKKNQIRIFLPVLIMGLLLLNLAGCKRYYDPPPYFEEKGDTTKPAVRKVLLIAIDGAVSSEYKTMQLPVLEGLKAHSKYSWDAISDESTTDATSWKTMMTGVSYSSHNISDSSFMHLEDQDDHNHGTVINYPSIFSYILSSAKSDMHTSLITPWSDMLRRLVPEVADPVAAANDQAVKDSALIRIRNERSEFITVHFNSVAIAGKTYGFSATATGYKDAAIKVDGYIGDLMTALKARSGYNKNEEWLVIITSTHGGKGNAYGGPSEQESSVFSFYYNENLKPMEMTKAGVYSGVQLRGRDGSAIKAVLDDQGEHYNVGTGQQTIQIKIKGAGAYYPHFFSKTVKWPGSDGWSMFAAGSSWHVSANSTSSNEVRIQSQASNVFDNAWHTITMVFADSANGWWLRKYADGVRFEQRDITALRNSGGSITSSAPLQIGWGSDPGQGALTFFAADVMIFDIALTDDEILSNLCRTDVKTHPKYANLIGYWPCNDAFGGRLKNYAPGGGPDFVLKGAFEWEKVEALPCTVPAFVPDASKQTRFVKNVDIAPTIFYWLKIPAKAEWKLEGSKWLEKYDIEFIKL